MMDIGPQVKKHREIQGLTLSELAAKADVSKAFIWEIEQGNSKRPGAEVLYKIASALNVTIAELMGKPSPKTQDEGIESEINDGLRAFLDEKKRQGSPLEPDEIKSLSYVQFRGGRPQTKDQWALVYLTLKSNTSDD